jgi:hypothetical protein
VTLDEFGTRLVRLHNYDEKPGLLIEIRRVLEGYSDDNLSRIWTKYSDSWRSDHSPRPAHFIEWSKEVQAQRKSDLIYYAKCIKCNAIYPNNGGDCPDCGEMEYTIHEGNRDTPHTPVKPGCSRCNHFKKEHAHGPQCTAWGLQDLTWKPCTTCLCYHCCSYEKLYREDPHSLPIDIVIKAPHELIFEGAPHGSPDRRTQDSN